MAVAQGAGLHTLDTPSSLQTATPDDVPLALARLGDREHFPEIELRGALVAFLSRSDLGRESGELRQAALLAVARDDPDPELRGAAVEGIARSAPERAGVALEELLDRLPALERRRAAKALAGLPAAREAVIGGVRREFGELGEARGLDAGTLAELLGAYGGALADSGAVEERDLALLARGARHPAIEVQLAAGAALEAAIDRMVELGRPERAFALVEGLSGRGLDERGLAWRRAWLALARMPDPEPARAAAAELAALARGGGDRADRGWVVQARYLGATLEIATGSPAAAAPLVDGALAAARALRAERLDLRPHPLESDPGWAREARDQRELAGQCELLRLLAMLAEGRAPSEREVLQRARAVHLAALDAQLASATSPDGPALGTLDTLLAGDLGPIRLMLENEQSRVLPRERAIELYAALCAALGAVAPAEMPGFTAGAVAGMPLSDPLLDLERRERLTRIHGARIDALWRLRAAREGEPGTSRRELDLLVQAARVLEQEHAALEERGWRPLLELRAASDSALWLSVALRAEGRAAESRELALRALADLDQSGLGATTSWGGEMAARLELAVGSSLTDERRPAEAEERLLAALLRQESQENAVLQSIAQGFGDGEDARQRERLLELVRRREVDVLVALAVNANVRMDDQERALGYFERAYALSQADGMKVLLACYRARSGRNEEARAALREVLPSPAQYYNLACTHALLGDAAEALDLLERDLEENQESPGSLARRREWAREDPDLASLRGDPRFERLVGGPP